MRNKLTRAIGALVVAAIAAITLAGCGGVSPGSTEDKANVAELQRRGFESPTLADGGGFPDGQPIYDVGVGKCRTRVYAVGSEWRWRTASGYPYLRDVNAATVAASEKYPAACK